MQRPTAEDAVSEDELDRLLAQPNRACPTGRRNLALGGGQAGEPGCWREE